jgi:hypothetical protein
MSISNLTAKKSKQISKILAVLNNTTISSIDYVSSNEPFFRNDNSAIVFQQYNNLFVDAQIPEGLNRNIKIVYQILGHQKREIYYGPWTIMSLNEALERYKVICAKGQTNVFDIGYKYGGMGYIDVLSCDLTNHLLFYRLDGGSNDYDRQYNLNELIKNGSQPYKKFYFSEWFYNVL